ncbi:hypothetical protein GDO86_005174 [Hymenochirus boettgeri]|uniref:Coiled-coil domain containing 69 n=1 Tax=Hymenochirus boettgeri TaxID=247094 RepID=A0A8T2J608_9PIPI|nr:hypothetical protein GDO86_005174 [Hymenochirus boettgeri]
MGCKCSKLCCPRLKKKKLQKKQKGEPVQELNDFTAKSHGPIELLQKIKEYEQEIRDILQKHQDEKKAQSEAHKTEIEARTQELLAQAQMDREAEIKRCLLEQAAILNTELEVKCAELQKSYDLEKLTLAESYQKITDSLQGTVDELNSQLASFREKMKRVEESVLTQDYKRHIQDYGTPGQFWEQELQSLHFVIEMKSELIREQEKRLLSHGSTAIVGGTFKHSAHPGETNPSPRET